jgi:hypothetical protein
MVAVGQGRLTFCGLLSLLFSLIGCVNDWRSVKSRIGLFHLKLEREARQVA